MFTSFMSVGGVPGAWKHAIVTPIYKGGSANSMSNYRPISLTSIACKIMKRVISADMLHYLRKNNVITKHQHGFLTRRSTSSNLLETLQDWTLTVKDRQSVVVAYIDFSKAFDCVSREKLLFKLAKCGITENLYKWIEHFLSHRTQQTRIGHSLSSCVDLISGVVQGSVLGPLLFLVYINDVINIFDGRCTCKLYADDVKIYTTVSFDGDIVYLQSKLDALLAWSKTWQLNISSSKCASMIIGDTKTEPVLYLDNNIIKRVNEYRDLGVIIDNALKFKSHINSVVAKANSRACLIHKCFVSRDIPTLVRAFKTYVRPCLEYASCIWSPSYVTLVNLIESVQRKFTKRLPGCMQHDYATRLAKLDLQSLELRRLHSDLILVYKMLFKRIDLDVSDFFVLSSNDHNTRGHRYKLVGHQCRINMRQHFFAERIINAWNALNAQASDFETLKSFKLCLYKNDFSEFLLQH